MNKVVAKPSKPVVRVEPKLVGTSIQRATLHPAQRADVQYPLCDAAVRTMAGGAWDLADAILAECSEPGKDGVRNGSQAKMEAMGQETVKNHGIDLSLVRIRKLRQLASAFPPDRRRSGVSVEAHLEAGTPETLDKLIKEAPQGTVFTCAKLRELKNAPTGTQETPLTGTRPRQADPSIGMMHDVCRQLEQQNEQLRQRYEESCRDAGKKPEPLAPPQAAKDKPPLTATEDLERGLRVLLLSRGIDPTVCEQAIADFVKAVVAQPQ